MQWEALALLLIGISVNQLRSLPEGSHVDVGFGTLMTAPLQWEGIPRYIVGIGRGISATVGLAATAISQR